MTRTGFSRRSSCRLVIDHVGEVLLERVEATLQDTGATSVPLTRELLDHVLSGNSIAFVRGVSIINNDVVSVLPSRELLRVRASLESLLEFLNVEGGSLKKCSGY